jgi:glycosyltransferase involved in cell wall biosynthesis
MRTECLSICKLAKKKGLGIALSTIYWPEEERWSYLSIKKFLGMPSIIYSNFKDYRYLTPKTLYPYKDFLETADVIIPTSKMEASVLSKKFRINPAKFFPVYIGVEKVFSNSSAEFFAQKFGLKDFVLFVGRIEKTKNVLSLIKACREIEIPLVIIGHYNSWEYEYFLECKKLMEQSPNVHYLGFLQPFSKELASAYAAAKVFALPSLHETAGLTALEAGLAGCNVVITRNSFSMEYFKNLALYVNPTSVKDIRKKVLEAYERPRTNDLRKYILDNYSEEQVAEATMEAYKLALNRDKTI